MHIKLFMFSKLIWFLDTKLFFHMSWSLFFSLLKVNVKNFLIYFYLCETYFNAAAYVIKSFMKKKILFECSFENILIH